MISQDIFETHIRKKPPSMGNGKELGVEQKLIFKVMVFRSLIFGNS